MKVERCDGCDAIIDRNRWPRVTGQGCDDSMTAGGPVSIRPGEQFDFCPACTTVAFTAVATYADLVRRLNRAGMTFNDHMLGLKAYVRDPLTVDEAHTLAAVTDDQQQSAALLRRYGHDGWRVARIAIRMLTQAPASHP